MARQLTRQIRNGSSQTVLGSDNGPHELMRAALGFSDISLDIPEDATLAQVDKTLNLAITGYKRLNDASERLKPIIGRILLTIKDRGLFKPDYKNFTAFLMERVVMAKDKGGLGLGRTHMFDSLRIAKAFPTMTTEEYAKYGSSRLLIAAKLTDESQEGYKATLKELSGLTVEEGMAKVREINAETPATSYTVSIRVSPEVKAEWAALIEAVDLTPGELFGQMVESMKSGLAQGYTARKPQGTQGTAVVVKQGRGAHARAN